MSIQEKRTQLKDLSIQVATMVKQGVFATINEAVLEVFYRKDGHTEFNTYKQWLEKGYQVRKGEKAFVLWAKPLGHHKEIEAATPEDESQAKYFPICHVFSNMQVDEIQAT